MVNRYGPAVTLRKRTRSGVDGDGNDVFTTSDATTFADAKWLRSSVEQTEDRDTFTDEMSLLFTGVPELTGIDQILITEGTFEVDGNPQVFEHPHVGLIKTQVNLRKVAG